MKFLNSVNATVGVTVNGDAVVPLKGLLPQELVDFVKKLYSFSVVPTFPPQVAFQGGMPLIFQAGQYIVGNDTKKIIQIAAVQNGDMVTGVNSDEAEIITRHYVEQLNVGLGFRYDLSNLNLSYVSNVVVQFDILKERGSILSKVEQFIESAIKSPSRKFRLKRLSFGDGDLIPVMPVDVDQFNKIDFAIEQRTKTHPQEFIFFSAAPMKTAAHLEALEKIEHLLAR
jgi:hypothetical protein